MKGPQEIPRLIIPTSGEGGSLMTTTAGIPGPSALPDAVDLSRAAKLLPAPVRSRAPWVLVSSDILGAALTAVVVGVVLPAWSPRDLLALTVVWPVLVAACGGYTSTLGVPHALRPRTLARSAAMLALFAWPVLAITPRLVPGRTADSARSLVLLVVLLPLFSVMLRAAMRPLAVPTTRRVVMVGDATALHHMLREARRETETRHTDLLPVAVCLAGDDPLDTAELAGSWADITILNGTDELTTQVHALGADAVVVAPGGRIAHAELRRWAAWFQDHEVELLICSGLRDVAPYRLGRSALGGMHLLQVKPASIRGISHLLKAALDRVAGACLLLLFGPLLLVLGFLIRRESPGPALYTQVRVGLNGDPFTVYKLRSMRQDADVVLDELSEENESDRSGVLFKMRQDPRITRLGSVLRKYSLDELPQLINVVRGEMSLIGPRPALPSEVDEYPADLCRRLAVKPGLTGLWQVSGRSDLSWEDTVRYDLAYVDNWSWALDFRIAVRTVSAVIGHKGAY
jgi:exopolysaccharide biosynthesis polyprenyl glycosylphosphotransferase